eukprot:scaffold10115_cov95-Skeletonema_dohrnii-CCMP3373.AAC.1
MRSAKYKFLHRNEYIDTRHSVFALVAHSTRAYSLGLVQYSAYVGTLPGPRERQNTALGTQEYTLVLRYAKLVQIDRCTYYVVTA